VARAKRRRTGQEADFHSCSTSRVSHSYSEQSFKLVLDSVVWAFKHAERNISETGLNILLELLHNISADENVSNAFYQKYFLSILQDIFFVLTDSFHKSGALLAFFLKKFVFVFDNQVFKFLREKIVKI
jgi:hypothetical protein